MSSRSKGSVSVEVYEAKRRSTGIIHVAMKEAVFGMASWRLGCGKTFRNGSGEFKEYEITVWDEGDNGPWCKRCEKKDLSKMEADLIGVHR